MLAGKHVVFLGGDARQLEVIKRFIKLNAEVSLIGFDNLQTPLSGTVQRELQPSLLQRADIVILPIVGTDDEGKVSSVFSSQEIYFTDQHLQALPSSCMVFTGMARPYLKKLCSKYEIQLFQLLQRNDVAIYNSIPTVEGALMMAIQHTDITIHQANCMVLGMGRVGMSMARVLYAMGAKVLVGVRSADDWARAYEMRLTPFHINKDLADRVGSMDIIFNTIPAKIIDASILIKMPHHILIIDLASKPGGVDYDFAKKRGIKALLAPSLPGIVAPKSAGQILANAIITLVREVLEKEGIGS